MVVTDIASVPALQEQKLRRISVLGATGSIGSSVRSVLLAQPGRFELEAVIGGKDVDALAKLAIELGAKYAVIADEAGYAALKQHLSGTGIPAAAGEAAILEAAQRPVDIVVSAITGIAGLAPTYAAACAGQTIALANKEAMVSAGDLVIGAAKRAGATILPMDSEHNALFQALGGKSATEVESMVLTASGGPFFEWPAERIYGATLDEALAHPNWLMGQKVTIDSASMMNKGLELIEAHHLFQIEPSRLDVLVHPQSIVHGLIFHRDGSVVAGMFNPDMRIPVAHCLAWPERLKMDVPRLDLAAIGRLSFIKPDRQRFPALKLAEEALIAGGAMPTVLNGANEVAVEAFLQKKISFGAIAELVAHVLDIYGGKMGNNATPSTLEEAHAVNLVSRRMALEGLSKLSARAIR